MKTSLILIKEWPECLSPCPARTYGSPRKAASRQKRMEHGIKPQPYYFDVEKMQGCGSRAERCYKGMEQSQKLIHFR